jgi:Rv2525c-like, glycoside hydrolase-like domain
MRRVIAAAVVGGFVLGGAVAVPSVAAARGTGKGPGKAGPAVPAKSKSTAGTKTVVYDRYEFQVPSDWPVYRLDEHPQTCVRYDIHAVYLGSPGTDMRCPARLAGRTQTVSVVPGHAGMVGTVAGSPVRSAAPEEVGTTEIRRLPAVHGVIMQNTVQRNLVVEGTSGVTVLATYATDPGIVERVLNSLHLAPAGTVWTTQSASTPSQPGGTTAGTSRRAELLSVRVAKASASATPKPTYTSWHGVPANWPVEIVQPAPPPRQPTPPVPVHPVSGFDTCTAPSTSAMHAWRSDYAAIGVYIGGVDAACAGGNLTASWMKTVAAMGWGTLPLYVGPQAPCWSGGRGVSIDPGNAAAQGKAAASDAVSDARVIGLAAGSPIYYDMEAYQGGSSCTSAVLAFLGAWDHQVNAAGYATGMYSSQDSGVADVQKATAGKMAGFTPPDAVWVALWDNVPSLTGNLAWPLADRNKQYAGNVSATVNGITLDIDKDIVGGPVARLPRGPSRAGCP